MSRSKGFLLVAAIAVAALALVGCAPTVHHVAQPTVHHVAATPSSTPTPAAPSVPTSLVSTTCTGLVQIATLNSVFPHHVTAQPFANFNEDDSPTSNFANLVPLQIGGLECYWADGPPSILPDSELAVEIIPNASTEFAAATPALTKGDDATTNFGSPVARFGTTSFTDCGSVQATCSFDISIGGYWLHIDQIDADAVLPLYPESAGEKAMLTSIVSAVTALPAPGASWTPPSDSAGLPTSCSTAVTPAQEESAFGLTKAVTPETGWGDDQFELSVNSSARLLYCSWTPDPNNPQLQLVVDILPGSSWAWTTTAPPEPASDHIAALTGTPDMRWGGCTGGPTNSCIVYAQVDHSWFDATMDSPKATVAKTEAIAADVIAATS